MSVEPKVITIDGPAGTGKSTVARRFANTLGFAYFDTGALYRAITWKLLQQKPLLDDKKELQRVLEHFSFQIKREEEHVRYFVGDVDVTEAIRNKEVTANVSKVSAFKEVRIALKPIQLDAVKETDMVFEGRDLGTVVFPHADLKFFLSARAEVRAERRLQELKQKFAEQSFSFEKILEDIRKRDQFDSTRAIAPLKQPEDAVVVDTSDLTIDQVVDEMKYVYHARVKN